MKFSIFLSLLLFPGALFAQQTSFGKAQISVPGIKGVLMMDVGPSAWQSRVRPDGKETQMQAMGRPDHLLISAFLQKVQFTASAEKCRDEWWPGTAKNSRIKMQGIRQSEKDGIAVVEYLVPEFDGRPVQQKNLHAYLGSRDLCAEVHLSKVLFVPGDQKRFDDVLATLQLLPENVAAVDPNWERRDRYFEEANQFYIQQNYGEAALRYQKVLDMEKQNRTLSTSFFRVLVDNLGMSYGIAGRLAKARETFEYGITQDPEYPLFYYNLACAYGEMNKMEESIAQLRLAYKYKANMIPGESMPDPLKDDSFRMFEKDKEFLDALREMEKP